MKKNIFAMIIMMFLMVSCNFIYTEEIPISEGDTLTSFSRAEMKNLLEKNYTFDELNQELNLQIIDESAKSLTATSDDVPNISFGFSSDDGTFILRGICAPASIMLPEYENMRTSNTYCCST